MKTLSISNYKKIAVAVITILTALVTFLTVTKETVDDVIKSDPVLDSIVVESDSLS